MLTKIVDLLKEVFWIKTSRKKTSGRKKKKTPARVSKKNNKPLLNQRKKVFKEQRVKASAKKPLAAKGEMSPKEKNLPAQPRGKKSAKDALPENLKQVGEITHYFDRIKVAVLKIDQSTVLIGDKLTVVGAKYRFVQKIWSMQIESLDVKVARKGQLVGIKVDKPVTPGDIVYK